MTRGQWIALLALGLLVFIAIGVGVIIWMRKKPTYVIEATPNTSGGTTAVAVPIVTGKSKVNNVTQAKRPASTGATYREIIGKRS